MKPEKQKIKDYAKDLFLQVDENGNKKYSLRDICEKILQKFHKSIDPKTILNWSNKENWINIYEKTKQAGIEQSKEDFHKKENQLIDAKANDIAEIYKGRKQLSELARKHLSARLTGQKIKINGQDVNISMRDNELLKLLQDSENTILNLNDKSIGENKNTNFNIVISKKEDIDSMQKLLDRE